MSDAAAPGRLPVPADEPAAVPAAAAPGGWAQRPGGVRAALEAVLLVVDAPAPEDALARALELPQEQVHDALVRLADAYRGEERGFELRRAGAGWRLYTRADLGDVAAAFVLDGQSARLSTPALETLAVIAYRQPVTRAQVAAVRGVDVHSVVRTLATRGLVEDAGPDPLTGATRYRTTERFLEQLGLTSLDGLPQLAPFLPDDEELDHLESLVDGRR